MPTNTKLSEFIKAGVPGLTPELLDHLPLPWHTIAESGAGYDIGEGLLHATQVALLLRQPMLITGDPGVGKTRFAAALAHRLQLQEDRFHRINVKTTTSGRDLLYSFDDIARFRDATVGRLTGRGGAAEVGIRPLASYVVLNGLGRAIVRSAGPAFVVRPAGVSMLEVAGSAHAHKAEITLGELFPQEFKGSVGPEHTLVLIDEMDKAPRDAPNDLLVEIEEMRFMIRELGMEIRASASHWPIVIFTSNSERSFPDPFLRRCIFHHIELPDDERLAQIVAERVSSLRQTAMEGDGKPKKPLIKTDSPLLKDAIEKFREARKIELDKPPGTAELIALVAALLEWGKSLTQPMSLTPKEAAQFAGIIAKTRRDEEKIRSLLL
jgi:MoxR-like ATPase